MFNHVGLLGRLAQEPPVRPFWAFPACRPVFLSPAAFGGAVGRFGTGGGAVLLWSFRSSHAVQTAGSAQPDTRPV